MTDRRHKNATWRLPPADASGKVSDATVTNAVLLDIRDELQTLNRLLGCYRVSRGMDALHSIDRRLAKHLPHRKPARPAPKKRRPR